jgi:hypothetical protein
LRFGGRVPAFCLDEAFSIDDDMIKPATPVKISFCATCKNRLWQLSHTMPPNLAAIEADGCSELVLVNYNSQDGLNDWIRQFRPAIEAGRLRYVHERSDPHFHMSKAKNLAHFAATGEFVVNLDADNLIGDTIKTYRRFWQDNPDTVIHGFGSHGTLGRIGIAKRHFLGLGGYDEELFPMSYQDFDLLARAEASGLDFIHLEQKGFGAIQNSLDEKMRYLGMDVPYETMKKLNVARSEESIRIGRLVANRERKPRPVLINFSTELEL